MTGYNKALAQYQLMLERAQRDATHYFEIYHRTEEPQHEMAYNMALTREACWKEAIRTLKNCFDVM